MDRAEPAKVQHAGDALGVATVRLHRHGLQGTLYMSGFPQNYVQTRLGQPTVQPFLRIHTTLRPALPEEVAIKQGVDSDHESRVPQICRASVQASSLSWAVVPGR